MSDSSCFVDSNIWIYSFLKPEKEPLKHQIANRLIKENKAFTSIQVINEVCSNLIRKLSYSEDEVEDLILDFFAECSLVEIDQEVLLEASRFRQRYSLSYYDSLIVSTALRSGTNTLYSEDMHHGLIVKDQLEI